MSLISGYSGWVPYLIPKRIDNNTPGASLMYGDFITYQASRLLKMYHSSYNHAALTVKAGDGVDSIDGAGSAPCNWVTDIRLELGKPRPPRMLALSFYGSSGPSCVGGAVGSAQFQDSYERAFDKIKVAADYVDTPVFWITPPPHHSSDPDPDLNTVIAGWAADRDWTVIDAGASVANGSGDWVNSLPCLVMEGAPQGCSGGNVVVRSADHNGFKFVVEDGTYTSYSSGATRWSTAIVTELPQFSPSNEGCTIWTCPSS